MSKTQRVWAISFSGYFEDFLIGKKPTYKELEQRVKELESSVPGQRTSESRDIAGLRKEMKDFLSMSPSDVKEAPAQDVEKIVEELRIHQVELEMQNEELRRAQLELQKSRNKFSDLYDSAPVG